MKLKVKENIFYLKFRPAILDKEQEFTIEKPKDLEEAWPVKSITATLDMRDSIGNILKIDGDRCQVKMIYRGSEVIARNVLIKDQSINKIGQRVMVTEHVNVAGKFDLLATIKRILNAKCSEVNFINFGWSDKNKSRMLRVDFYTGETHLFDDGPNFGKFLETEIK